MSLEYLLCIRIIRKKENKLTCMLNHNKNNQNKKNDNNNKNKSLDLFIQ